MTKTLTEQFRSALMVLCLGPGTAFSTSAADLQAAGTGAAAASTPLHTIPAEVISAPLINLEQAVSSTIDNSYGIRLERLSTEFGEGQLTSAEGEFDWTLVSELSSARERLPPLDPLAYGTDTNSWEYSAGVQKKLRNGILVSPNVGAGMLQDPDETSDRWISRGAINFEMLMPLARGAGEASAAVDELFARKDLDSRYALYRHQIASDVLDTVAAYWECIGATQTLQILLQSEQEAETMEATVLRLSAANLFSRAYVEQAQSNSREKKTRRINAELDQYKARQALAVAMGMDDIELAAPPVPGEGFPELRAPELPGTSEYARVIRYAQDKREDLRAARDSKEALAILSRAARHDLRPRVDLSLNLSYDGIDKGHRPHAFLFNENDGLRVMGGVSIEFPLQNRVNSGLLRQRLAEEDEASVLRQQLGQSIASEIMVAISEVESTYNAYQVSLEAERYYAEALEKERNRFLVGDASFIDVIALQDGYRDSQLDTITARQDHLIALATLRFTSGTLVEGSAAAGSVNISQLTETPAFE